MQVCCVCVFCGVYFDYWQVPSSLQTNKNLLLYSQLTDVKEVGAIGNVTS